MSEPFSIKRSTQRFSINIENKTPDKHTKTIIFPIIRFDANGLNDKIMTKTYDPVKIKAINSNRILTNVVPGDYTYEYPGFTLDSAG